MKQLYTIIAIAAVALTSFTGKLMGQTGSRLIAQSHYYVLAPATVLSPYDSQKYTYPNTISPVYTEKLSYLYPNHWIHTGKSDFTYNSNNKLTQMQYQKYDTTAMAYTDGSFIFYTLNSAGYCVKDSSILWIPASSAYRDNARDTYILDTAGRELDGVYDAWDNGTNGLLHTYHYVNTYNTHGNPLTILTQDWDATIHWMNSFRNTYAYDGTGTHLQTVTGEQAVSTPGVLQTTYQDVYTLNPNGSIASYLLNNWNSSTSSYTPNMSITLAYDTAGNAILQTEEQWNPTTSAYQPYDQYINTYNAYNQMTSHTHMRWDGTAYATPYTRDSYYYEEYSNPTGIDNIEAAEATFILAPIPAKDDVHIALKWAQPQAFTAVVTDMAGRPRHTFSAPESKEYAGTINLGNLEGGNYILTIKGARGGTLTRMFVLIH